MNDFAAGFGQQDDGILAIRSGARGNAALRKTVRGLDEESLVLAVEHFDMRKPLHAVRRLPSQAQLAAVETVQRGSGWPFILVGRLRVGVERLASGKLRISVGHLLIGSSPPH